MEAAPPVENIVHAVQTLYHNPDASEKERASKLAWSVSEIGESILRMLHAKHCIETACKNNTVHKN